MAGCEPEELDLLLQCNVADRTAFKRREMLYPLCGRLDMGRRGHPILEQFKRNNMWRQSKPDRSADSSI